MPSTNQVDIAPVAEGLVELWGQPRRHYLAKRQPRSAAVAEVRKKILAYIAKPFHMLIAGSFADIEDGAPLHVVLAPWYAAIGEIRVKAAQRAEKRGASVFSRMNALMLRETTAQSELDKAQLMYAANPADRASLVTLSVAMRSYDAIHDEMQALIAEQLAYPTSPAA